MNMETNLFLERYEAARTKRLASKDGARLLEFTIGDLMNAIWSVESEGEMRPFFDGYVVYLQGRDDCDNPEGVARSNIGWMFGEGMAQDRIELWVRTTQSSHPILGTMVRSFSPDELMQQGADAMRRSGEARHNVS